MAQKSSGWQGQWQKFWNEDARIWSKGRTAESTGEIELIWSLCVTTDHPSKTIQRPKRTFRPQANTQEMSYVPGPDNSCPILQLHSWSRQNIKTQITHISSCTFTSITLIITTSTVLTQRTPSESRSRGPHCTQAAQNHLTPRRWQPADTRTCSTCPSNITLSPLQDSTFR